MNGKQRKQFLDNRVLEDISEEEFEDDYLRSDNYTAKYESRANRSKPPSSKRMRRTASSDRSESGSSTATKYFPDPVPAIRRRSSYTASTSQESPRRSHSDSGNDHGARTRRSSLVSPNRRGGSRQRRGRGSSGHRDTRSPISRDGRGMSRSPRRPAETRPTRGRSTEGSRRRSDRR